MEVLQLSECGVIRHIKNIVSVRVWCDQLGRNMSHSLRIHSGLS